MPDRLRSTHHGHAQVHQRYVGTVHTEELDGLAPVAGLGDELQIRIGRHQCRQATPEKGVIIDGHHSDDFGIGGGHTEECPCPQSGGNTPFG